jgi:hypothetical protein
VSCIDIAGARMHGVAMAVRKTTYLDGTVLVGGLKDTEVVDVGPVTSSL